MAPIQVQAGINSFSRLYGRLPGSWAEVKSAGLWDVPLYGFNGELIDPDDPELNFWGDVHYDTRTSPPQVRQFTILGESLAPPIALSPSRTLHEQLTRIDQDYAEANTQRYLSDERRMKQFAILHGVGIMLSIFQDIYGRHPLTFQEFLSSGLGPINASSINPVTGVPFVGDSRANDVLYRYHKSVDSDGNRLAASIQHIEADGQPPHLRFSY